MKILHRAPRPVPPTDAEVDIGELAKVDYDAQADLALHTPAHPDSTTDGFVPFAGMLTPDHHDEPGYDVDRDVAP